MNKPVRNSLALAVVCAALTACGGSSSGSSKGTLSLSLTDAPVTGFTSVELTITGVTLKPAGGNAIVYTFDEAKSFDLLQLQNGVSASLLDEVSVPAGEYNWVRLAVDTSNMSVTETGGAEKTLEIPSGAETGLKLVKGFTVAQGGVSDFTIDFDVRKSIVEPTGNSADYFLKPVLRLVDNLQVGTVSGSVDGILLSEQCADSSVYAGSVYVFSGADATVDDLGSDAEPLVVVPVVYSEDNSAYQYTAAFLEAGDYTIGYTCDADDNEVDETLNFYGVQNTGVAQDQTTTVDFVAVD